MLWVDTFTNRFSPEVAEAAVQVLEAAGGQVGVVALDDACCGLTWVSTGQLDQARSRLGSLLDRLDRRVPGGVPVVALEPSCLAVLRDDSQHLLADRPAVADRVVTLAEHLATLDWEPPDLAGAEVVAQPHCHHASVLGWSADETLLRRAGASLTRVGGCCGLAGNFGMEKGHYDVSVAVFEHDLGPAVRSHPDAVVLADGFSCRTQLADLEGRESSSTWPSPWRATSSPTVAEVGGSRRSPRLTSGFSLARVRRLDTSGAPAPGAASVLTLTLAPGSLGDRAWNTQAITRARKRGAWLRSQR